MSIYQTSDELMAQVAAQASTARKWPLIERLKQNHTL